ncbi:MAG: hypothetical protein V1690_01765 [Candidatus Moraniibacteriota bacterium]
MTSRKKNWLLIFSGIVLILVGFLWFYTKFFPAQTGEWVSNKPDNFSEEKIPDFGFRGSQFWMSVDYPGKLDVCLNIDLKSTNSNNQLPPVSVVQSPRAASYPLAGNLNSLFQEQSPAAVAENINQDKPYLLNHLADNIIREGKDIFFAGAGEKFLLPTKNIFTAYFPNIDIPSPSDQNVALTYSNKLISFPEGVLLSDGKGVFIVSNRKLALIRSPEIFDSLGYKWEEVRQMSRIDMTFNPYLSGNLIDFDAAHPNGTILKNEGDLFLVWNEKLYTLNEEERTKYFPGAPAVEMKKIELKSTCATTDNKKFTCCINNFDPRLNAPQSFPFANTLSWNLGQFIPVENIGQISWQAKVAVNKENTLHRLGSFKNFIFYTLGIVK